jgi:putative SOS response-associated peptidase YedK
MRWGLIPFCSRRAPEIRTVNARFETLQTAASYRDTWPINS